MSSTRTTRPHRSPRHRLQLFVARHRRVLAALLVGLGTLLAVGAARPAPAPTVGVLAVEADLPAGVTLSSADVHVVRLPTDVAPAGALRPSTDVVGRVVAGPMRAGELLTDRRLLGTTLVAGFPAGTVAAPVRILDPASVDMLRVGDHVNVYAATEGGGHDGPLVADATVVALPRSDDLDEGALVVLAVTSEQAASLTDASATTVLGVALLGSGHPDR